MLEFIGLWIGVISFVVFVFYIKSIDDNDPRKEYDRKYIKELEDRFR